jgi:hypothetical protein
MIGISRKETHLIDVEGKVTTIQDVMKDLAKNDFKWFLRLNLVSKIPIAMKAYDMDSRQ